MVPDVPTIGPPRRPWLFWPALLVAGAVVVGGVVEAATSYARSGGPDGVVRTYFQALQHSDAAAALGLGEVPSGSRTLLTSAVLQEQQRVAPIVDLRIGSVRRSGARADVAVSYVLRYGDGDSAVSASVAVHRSDGDWRLDDAVVRTRLTLGSASQRATVLGRQVPAGEVLAFPGAPPISFDTSYLMLEPDVGIVAGSTAARVYSVTVTSAGRAGMRAAVRSAVSACVSATQPATTCPLPTERYLPGSVHGSLAGELSDVRVSLTASPLGTLDLTAEVPVLATSYRRLDFRNRVDAGQGRVTLALHAVAAARAPLSISWLAP